MSYIGISALTAYVGISTTTVATTSAIGSSITTGYAGTYVNAGINAAVENISLEQYASNLGYTDYDEFKRDLKFDAELNGLIGGMVSATAIISTDIITTSIIDNVVDQSIDTKTVWDDIFKTADNIKSTKIPSTFSINLNDEINYLNPSTNTNTLWTNSNATKHMGEYIARFGDLSWSIELRSQIILESYSASLNEAMRLLSNKTPGRYFGVFGNWQLGINTQTGVVYHAMMIK